MHIVHDLSVSFKSALRRLTICLLLFLNHAMVGALPQADTGYMYTYVHKSIYYYRHLALCLGKWLVC